MSRTFFFVCLFVTTTVFSNGANAQQNIDLSISLKTPPAIATQGRFLSTFHVHNAGDSALSLGAQVTVKVLTSEANKAYKVFGDDWVCGGGYQTHNGNGNQYNEWTLPDTFDCTYTLQQDLVSGAYANGLNVFMDGGYPDELCLAIIALNDATGTSLVDASTENDEICFAYPPEDFDLLFSFGKLTQGIAPNFTHIWKINVINAGPTAVPVHTDPLDESKKTAGFRFRSEIPEGAAIKYISVYSGWSCGLVKTSDGAPIIVPIAYVNNNAVADFESESTPFNGARKILQFQGAGHVAPTGGATIQCDYVTKHQFGAQAELGVDTHPSGAPSYTINNWPDGENEHCGEIFSLNNALPEKANKLANNRWCWDMAEGKSVPWDQ